MHKLRFKTKSVPFALLFFCFTAYGILIPNLGFYWDDWPMMWFAHIFGPSGFPAVFSGDRPFLSLVYILTTSILDTIPWQWQILCILSRWLTGLAFWWTLRQLWPEHPEPTTWMALLLVVYPGFKQMPISVVYGNGLLLVIPYFLSFGLNIRAVREPKRYWLYTLAGLVSYAFCVFSTEYYIGLDMVRGLFLWIVLSESIPDLKTRTKVTIKHWLPYLALLGIFIIWRIFIFQFPTYQPELINEVNTSPLTALLDLGNRIFQDLVTAGWSAWFQPFSFPNLAEIKTSSAAVKWIAVLFTSLLGWFFLSKLSLQEPANSRPATANGTTWTRQAILLGMAGLILPGLPYWVTNLPLNLSFPYDRFHLAFMAGSCIFLVGLICWAFRTHLQKIILLSLIIGMASGAHLSNANSYRREWLTLKDMFWQLSWRVPAIKANTFVLTDHMPFTYYSDNSLTAPLNWQYGPQQQADGLEYYLGFTSVRLGASLPALEKGHEINQKFRNVTFSGSTDDVLTIFYSPPGCLRVIDPSRDADVPIFPDDFYDSMLLSDISQVITDPAENASPPVEIFGSPPEPTWCYYYQKADLARQRGNWTEVVRLGNEAFPSFSPQEPSELILFVEGYARTGNWARSMELVEDAYHQSKNLQAKLCRVMKDIDQELAPAGEMRAVLDSTRHDLECP